MEVWKEYEEKLLNEKNVRSIELNIGKNEGPCEKVSVETVTEALNLMKMGKAAGPSDVTPDLLKASKNEKVGTSG